jgi:hypothetical protein
MSIVTIASNVFSNEDIEYLTQCPQTIAAKEALMSSNVSYFKVPLTASICQSIKISLGLDLENVSQIPMRWITGDTTVHNDVGTSAFENTYLVYLTDSAGEFIVGDKVHSIESNHAFVFSEGTTHFTQNTGDEPRLLLGPMNEFAEPVGYATQVTYYLNEADALAQTNVIYYGATFQVGEGQLPGPGGYNKWRIASNSTGPSPQNVIYNIGDLLIGNIGYVLYYMYPVIPCFLGGTKVLVSVNGQEKYVPIETLRKGDLVKTSRDGFKKVEVIGHGNIMNPANDERTENRLYKCSASNYHELKEDLYITGCHSILVDTLSDSQKEETIKHLGQTFVTDGKYRLMACIDERAKPWNLEGRFTIWHLALENADPKMNYGIYVNGGLLVETTSINFLKNRSNMELQ